jgi:hypothetical protein
MPSCYPQTVNLGKDAGLQSVINTIYADDKHQHHTLHFVVNIPLTYKTVLLILPSIRNNILSINV